MSEPARFYINMTQAKVILKEETFIEKIPHQIGAEAILLCIFLIDIFLWWVQPTVMPPPDGWS